MQSLLNQVLHMYLFIIHGTWPGLWLLLIWTWRHLTRSPGLWCIVCNARGHGQRPLARGSSDLFWSSGWRNNKGEDWAAMREREATEITNKARSGDAMTTWPGLPMTMSTFRDLTEKRWQCSWNSLKMQFKRAAQLYTTVVTILESVQLGADGPPPNTTRVR